MSSTGATAMSGEALGLAGPLQQRDRHRQRAAHGSRPVSGRVADGQVQLELARPPGSRSGRRAAPGWWPAPAARARRSPPGRWCRRAGPPRTPAPRPARRCRGPPGAHLDQLGDHLADVRLELVALLATTVSSAVVSPSESLSSTQWTSRCAVTCAVDPRCASVVLLPIRTRPEFPRRDCRNHTRWKWLPGSAVRRVVPGTRPAAAAGPGTRSSTGEHARHPLPRGRSTSGTDDRPEDLPGDVRPQTTPDRRVSSRSCTVYSRSRGTRSVYTGREGAKPWTPTAM